MLIACCLYVLLFPLSPLRKSLFILFNEYLRRACFLRKSVPLVPRCLLTTMFASPTDVQKALPAHFPGVQCNLKGKSALIGFRMTKIVLARYANPIGEFRSQIALSYILISGP